MGRAMVAFVVLGVGVLLCVVAYKDSAANVATAAGVK